MNWINKLERKFEIQRKNNKLLELTKEELAGTISMSKF